MERIIHSDTIAAQEAIRDKCAADLKRLEQTMQGLEIKIAQTRAKLEMAQEMVEAAISTQPKKPMAAAA